MNNKTTDIISIHHRCILGPHQDCDPNLLLDSFQEPEVQVVLIAVEEALVVGEDQVPWVVTPVDDVRQLYVVLVPAIGVVAEFHTHIHPPGPEPTAALIQPVVNLKRENAWSWCVKNRSRLVAGMSELQISNYGELTQFRGDPDLLLRLSSPEQAPFGTLTDSFHSTAKTT